MKLTFAFNGSLNAFDLSPRLSINKVNDLNISIIHERTFLAYKVALAVASRLDEARHIVHMTIEEQASVVSFGFTGLPRRVSVLVCCRLQARTRGQPYPLTIGIMRPDPDSLEVLIRKMRF